MRSDSRPSTSSGYTLSTRLDDPKRDAIVVVMQRLHTRDLTAVCLEQGFEHLCLPALAPSHTTIVFPRSGRTVVRELDSPLWPERQGVAELEHQRQILGSYGFAGQYQQSPVPRDGGMFKPEWWQVLGSTPDAFRRHHPVVGSELQGAGRVMTTSSVSRSAGLARWSTCSTGSRRRASFTETCHAIKQMVAKYPSTRAVLIEDAANGPAVVSALQKEIRGILAVTPEGGKWSRAAAVQPQVEAGQVLLPRPRFADG